MTRQGTGTSGGREKSRARGRGKSDREEVTPQGAPPREPCGWADSDT